MMADNLFAIAERGPTLVHAHNAHLQRHKSTMRMGGLPLEWWSAGAIVSTRLGEEYAFLATALGTIRHQGVDTPPPDTVEGLLYVLPEDHYVVDSRRLVTTFGNARPAPRVSPYYGYSPLDPAHLADSDGIVFVKDVPQTVLDARELLRPVRAGHEQPSGAESDRPGRDGVRPAHSRGSVRGGP
nr:erythromycin esterase family protein [Thermomonospora echinospora]